MARKTIKAGPTKRFFVSMLTRDIDLADAILDLLDNSIDGVLRVLNRKGKRKQANGRPYEGFRASIKLSPERFEISDNCGGISEELAEESAFMLGRPDPDRDSEIETVGMYGIGLKRAIFKLGERCTVASQPDTGSFQVEITPEWLKDDDDWELILEKIQRRSDKHGTSIVVEDLYAPIKHQFDTDRSEFIDDLKQEISRHYARIIDKGFTVEVNGRTIKPVELQLLVQKEPPQEGMPAIEPYVFTAEVRGVSVELAVGFYRPLATESEIEMDQNNRRTRDDAGWTVICNDRVVLYNDKSRVTGWGTATVPSYHNQFISIAGVVSFRSRDSMKLPLNTTKRGLDTSSEVYLLVLDRMREGMKIFTSFTNKWKRREEETKEHFKQLKKTTFVNVPRSIPQNEFKSVSNQQGFKRAQRYSPDLPKPETPTRHRRIIFLAAQEEIELLGNYFFEDLNTDKNEVGRRCFDEALELARV